MNENLFNLLPERRMYFLRNYYQNVVPFQFDESLELYTLLNKLVNYCNELGERNNSLMDTTRSLVDFLNNQLQNTRNYIIQAFKTLENNFNNFKTDFERNYNNFTEQVKQDYNNFVTEINQQLETYKTSIENTLNTNLEQIREVNAQKYNDLQRTLDEAIQALRTTVTDMQTTIDTDISSFETQVNEQLATIETKRQENFTNLNSLLNEYKRELDESINDAVTNTNLVPAVTEALNNYDFTLIAKNLYGGVIYISQWNTDTPVKVHNASTLYHYNPDTGVLTNLLTLEPMPLDIDTVYIYEGYVYFYYQLTVIEHLTSLVLSNSKLIGSWGKYNLYSTDNYDLKLLDLETNILINVQNLQSALEYGGTNCFYQVGDYNLISYNTNIRVYENSNFLYSKNEIAFNYAYPSRGSFFDYNGEYFIVVSNPNRNGCSCFKLIAGRSSMNVLQRVVVDLSGITSGKTRYVLKPMEYNGKHYVPIIIVDNEIYHLYLFEMIISERKVNFLQQVTTFGLDITSLNTTKYGLIDNDKIVIFCKDTTGADKMIVIELSVNNTINYTINLENNNYFIDNNTIMSVTTGNLNTYELKKNNDTYSLSLLKNVKTSVPANAQDATYYNNKYLIHGNDSIDVISIHANDKLMEIPYQRKSDV